MKKKEKNRLDLVMLEKTPGLSRNKAQALIMAGKVCVNGIRADKPGSLIDVDAEVTIIESANPYASRGGLKLEGALLQFGLDVKGLTVLDVGASTGGFTDCLLKMGASQVIALDVGYGQLDLKLRNDQRVMVMERFNIRNLKPDDLAGAPDLAVVDVSFISLKLVIPVLFNCAVPGLVALVKPQFEVGKSDAGRGRGVIRDPLLHRQVLNEIISASRQTGYYCRDLTLSKYPVQIGRAHV